MQTDPPSQPPLPADPQEREARHRQLRRRLSLGLGAVMGAFFAVPFLGSLLSPAIRRRERAWARVGRVDDFPLGQTVKIRYQDPEPLPWATFTATGAAWLRREGPAEFVVFSGYCTHTGCPIRWVEGARLFLCPCHGGAFADDGRVVAGPPPRPLERFPVRIRGGWVEVSGQGIPLEAVARTGR